MFFGHHANMSKCIILSCCLISCLWPFRFAFYDLKLFWQFFYYKFKYTNSRNNFGLVTMADSDDEYDRKRRDKFRGERGTAEGSSYRSSDRREERSRGREDWSERYEALKLTYWYFAYYEYKSLLSLNFRSQSQSFEPPKMPTQVLKPTKRSITFVVR